jgi:hypothetical protein
MNSLDHFNRQRNTLRQRQVAHLYEAGPRPVMEALLAVEAGQDLDDVLADFARVAISTYRAIGADELPIDRRFN